MEVHRSGRPEPEDPVQPLRVIEHREAHEAEAKAGGVEDLMEFRALYTRELLIHVALAGPEDGEPVVLLHGFPDLWVGWSHQIRPLVEAGYRVILPEQRGYNLSEKPREVEAYTQKRIATDVIDVINALGHEQAHLVGHDWGGAISWWLGRRHPERFKTLTIVNCPPADVLFETAKRYPRQFARSWYIGLFQLPRVAEKVIGARDFRLLEKALTGGAADNAFSAEELQAYRRAWARPGALTGMLNWYRAAGRETFKRPVKGKSEEAPGQSSRMVHIPTTIIWGKQDFALDEALIGPSADCCSDVEVFVHDEAGHWVQRDAPEFVTEKLLGALRRG